MSTLLKTNSAAYVAAWERYTSDCIDIDGDESPDLYAKLCHASRRFHSEFCYPANMCRYPNVQTRLTEYLQGLPFHFAFTYSDIVATACKLHGVQSLNDRQESMVQLEWFRHCALMLLRVAKRNGVEL